MGVLPLSSHLRLIIKGLAIIDANHSQLTGWAWITHHMVRLDRNYVRSGGYFDLARDKKIFRTGPDLVGDVEDKGY
jgi:hypothetical protein